MKAEREVPLESFYLEVRPASCWRTAPARIFLSGLLALFLILYAGQYSQAQVPRLTVADRSDIQYVLGRSKNGAGTALDLSDPVQNRFLKKQLELAGFTRKLRPQLFRSLQQSLSRPRNPRRKQQVISVTGPQALNIITDVKTNDQQSFIADALSSVYEGTSVTTLTLGLYDQYGNLLGPVQGNQQFNEGTDLTVSAAGDFQKPPPPAGQPVTAIATYFYEKDGVPFSGTYTSTSNYYPLGITSTAPNVINDPNQINICLNRQGIPTGCDYACSVGYNCTQTANSCNPPNVIFPVIGQVVFNGNIDPIQYDQQGNPTNAFSRITVAFTAAGGGCTQEEPTNFFKDANTKINGNILSWNLNPAQFGLACYPESSPAAYSFSVYVSINGSPVYAYINNTGGTPAKNTLVIKPTTIWVGCLAKGTRILMDDKSERAIETFNARERIASSPEGTILTVANTLVGIEKKPMIRILTERGQSLLLTDAHPVVTTKGVRLARRLAIGDRVLTVNGEARIASIDSVLFDGSVWNLDVGVPEDKINITKENTTFFANGILVGDSKMQDYWDVMDRQARKSVLESIPRRWHQDYLNWMKESRGQLKLRRQPVADPN